MLTQSSEIRQHVDEEEPVIWFIACHWIQAQVQLLQLRVLSQTMQLFKAANVVVISLERVKAVTKFTKFSNNIFAKRIQVEFLKDP